MFSPFGSLPDNAKWGVNMSGKVCFFCFENYACLFILNCNYCAEHVAFENLPNYTGHWDKMKAGVIQKIRDRKAEEENVDEEES